MLSQFLRCQTDTVLSSSSPVNWLTVNARKLRWHLSNRGVVATGRKVLSVWERAVVPRWLHRRFARAGAASVHIIPLNLQPGELVEVKSEREIAESLDANCTTRGLSFMEPMRAFCGKRMRVYKRVNHILLEFGGGERKLTGTVLLEGAICDGREQACDRSCFFFWREAWLRRIPIDTEQPDQASLERDNSQGEGSARRVDVPRNDIDNL